MKILNSGIVENSQEEYLSHGEKKSDLKRPSLSLQISICNFKQSFG